jgi:hypothetical protein
MAISDRNLAIGTKLWARYKGQVHTAELIEFREGNDERGLRYLLPDGRSFRSPSAAGTAITGKACNGWAFWSVGEPTEKPAKAEGATGSKRSSAPAPKPEKKPRTRKERTIPRDGNDQALPIVAQVDGTFECGNCGASFATSEAAKAHLDAAHPAEVTGDQPDEMPAADVSAEPPA